MSRRRPRSRRRGGGRAEIAYINGTNGNIYAIDRNNESTKLLDPSTLSGVLDKGGETDKTKMAVGVWNDSGPAVFFVDDGESYIYYANETDSVEVVKASIGASAVLGVLDYDGDGTASVTKVTRNGSGVEIEAETGAA